MNDGDARLPGDIFEQFAEEYDRWFDEHNAGYRAELARVRRLLPRPDSRAVEVGVGSGRFAALLGIRLGIEPSRALGRMARERGIEVIQGRAESIPLRDGACSSVLLVTVIYLFPGRPGPGIPGTPPDPRTAGDSCDRVS
ncbi:MAG: hypothetical protein LLF90_09435 [Methanomicrobiaceae archaeon]|uniref:class I SAM-dependent methyltransferase n=1 Tax=Methanoculleus sp. TaxID=90427 RepID=UPI00320C6368|nr:hypothetical protein [Methanomicrobiaceae archaeon]